MAIKAVAANQPLNDARSKLDSLKRKLDHLYWQEKDLVKKKASKTEKDALQKQIDKAEDAHDLALKAMTRKEKAAIGKKVVPIDEDLKPDIIDPYPLPKDKATTEVAVTDQWVYIDDKYHEWPYVEYEDKKGSGETLVVEVNGERRRITFQAYLSSDPGSNEMLRSSTYESFKADYDKKFGWGPAPSKELFQKLKSEAMIRSGLASADVAAMEQPGITDKPKTTTEPKLTPTSVKPAPPSKLSTTGDNMPTKEKAGTKDERSLDRQLARFTKKPSYQRTRPGKEITAELDEIDGYGLWATDGDVWVTDEDDYYDLRDENSDKLKKYVGVMTSYNVNGGAMAVLFTKEPRKVGKCSDLHEFMLELPKFANLFGHSIPVSHDSDQQTCWHWKYGGHGHLLLILDND
jgi:hypothetical protein